MGHQFADKLKKGDRAYVWVTGKLYGLYAIGTIAEMFSSTAASPPVLDRARVLINELLPTVVARDVMEQDEVLRTLSFIRGPPNQQIYSLTSKFVDSLAKLLSTVFVLKRPSLSSSLPNSPTLPASQTSTSQSPLSSNDLSPPSTPMSNGDKSVHLATSPSSPPVITPLKTNGAVHFPSSSSSSVHSQSPLTSVKSPLISPTTHPPSLISNLLSPFTQAPFTSISNQVFNNIAPMISHTSSSSAHTCDVCKRAENNVTLQCLGCKDWYHPACTTTPTGTLSLLPFYCPPCSALNQQTHSCVACDLPIKPGSHPLLACDMCSKSYHITCAIKAPSIDSSSSNVAPTPPMPRCWLCTSCMPTQIEKTNALLLVGWNELRHDCFRILSSECEFYHDALRKGTFSYFFLSFYIYYIFIIHSFVYLFCINTGITVVNMSKSQNRVYGRMQELTNNLAELRRAVVAMAQSRYGIWAKEVVSDAPPQLL